MYVLVCHCGWDSVYSDPKFEEIKNTIPNFRKVVVNCFVFGILNEDGSVNKKQNRVLVALASPLPCTFHPAFGVLTDINKLVEEVIEGGLKTKFNNLWSAKKFC